MPSSQQAHSSSRPLEFQEMEKEKLIDDEHWKDFWRKKAEWQQAAKYMTLHFPHNNTNGHTNHIGLSQRGT